MGALFWETLRLDGDRVDADVQGRLITATLTRQYDGATSLQFEFNDPDMRILTSGLISKRGKVTQKQFDQAAWARFGDTRLTLDGRAFRLVRAEPAYDAGQTRITLAFEDELAVLMRQHKGPKRIRRGSPGEPGKAIPWSQYGDTRATAIMSLAFEALRYLPGQLPFYSVGANKVQPVKGATGKESPAQQAKGVSRKGLAKERQKGLASWRKLTIKAKPITATQKRNLETALNRADAEKAGDPATLAMLCAGIAESSFIDQMNGEGSGYGGVFQGQVAVPNGQNWFAGMAPDKRTDEEAKSFLRGGRGYQGGGAITLAAQHPGWGPGRVALTVEGSLANFGGVLSIAENFYGQWAHEAQAILDAWGGTSEVKVITKPYYYTVGKGENYFDAAGRLAQEVRWRFWIDDNEVWYVPDRWLFKSATTLEFTPTTEGVRGFSGQADVGEKIGELLVTVNLPRWVGAPAWRCEVDGMGPFNGLWLLAMNEQDLITEDCTVTLRRPAPALPEPASPTKTITLTESTPARGTTRQKIVAVAQRAMKAHSHYNYRELRPMHHSLFGHTDWPIWIDCSEFVTLCYKAAGAPDPNGAGYDGSGNTQTLAANGTRTNDPQPGDLCLYGAAPYYSHVTIYIGDGQQIGIGSRLPLGIHQAAVKYRSDFAAYFSFPGVD